MSISWKANGQFHEYVNAVNPPMAPVPYHGFSEQLHHEGPSRIITCDRSQELNVNYPASTPNCMMNFIRLEKGSMIPVFVNASSQSYYVIRGKGVVDGEFGQQTWSEGDVLTVPACQRPLMFEAFEDSAFYWVHNEPMFSYLGARAHQVTFAPTYYDKASIHEALAGVLTLKDAAVRNRNGILFGNPVCEQTKTITPTLWALFNQIAPGQVQAPHRHNATAMDFVVSCASDGVYTLISKKIDEKGQLVDPHKEPWRPGAAFITPPGYWHSHHNESDESAIVFPLQDAGFYVYNRTYGIEFWVD